MKSKNRLITQLTMLDQRCIGNVHHQDLLTKVIERHPMKIPPYYYQLIDQDDPDDPIRKMAIPTIEELNNGGDIDTSGELFNTKLPSLQHKYQQTVLVLSTNVCFMYCRHCFRKRMVGYSNDEIIKRMNQTIAYVKAHHKVNNVLISGGDAFALNNQIIEKYLKKLCEIEHLDFIRFGTRSMVVKPDRINQKLIDILKKYQAKKTIIVVTQFNHPNELTMDAKKAIDDLLSAGVTIRNQTVLLRGVNDQEEVLVRLFSKLTQFGVHPYYLFQCRPVKGATHFQVPFDMGLALVNQMKSRLNGIAKGFRYVMSHKRGKIEIIEVMNDHFVFKFHEHKHDQDDHLMFMIKVNEQATWLDDDLSLI